MISRLAFAAAAILAAMASAGAAKAAKITPEMLDEAGAPIDLPISMHGPWMDWSKSDTTFEHATKPGGGGGDDNRFLVVKDAGRMMLTYGGFFHLKYNDGKLFARCALQGCERNPICLTPGSACEFRSHNYLTHLNNTHGGGFLTARATSTAWRTGRTSSPPCRCSFGRRACSSRRPAPRPPTSARTASRGGS